jgi:hypothetical protein
MAPSILGRRRGRLLGVDANDVIVVKQCVIAKTLLRLFRRQAPRLNQTVPGQDLLDSSQVLGRHGQLK